MTMKSVRSKNYARIKLRLFLLIIFSFHDAIINGQCDLCLQQVEILGRQVKTLNISASLLRYQKDSLITKLNISQSELYRLRLSSKSQPDDKNSTNLSNDNTNKEIVLLKSELSRSKKKIFNLNNQLNAKQSSINQKETEIEKLKKLLDEVEKTLQETITSKDQLKGIIDCINEFQKDAQKSNPIVNSELEKARADFNKYKSLIRNKYSNQDGRNELIGSIINTYKNYKGEFKVSDCGGIELSYYKNDLLPIDHGIIAEIYGKNLGNAVELLEENNINEANRKILESAGVIMEKGDYDQRSAIFSNINKYIVQERRSGSINSEAKAAFGSIINLYDKGMYLESIIMFDKMEKFSELKEIEKEVVLKAKLYIGNILLWDMASLGQNFTIILNGDWVKSCGSDRVSCGMSLLNDVIQSFDFSSQQLPYIRNIKKQASISLAKYYD